MPWSKLHQNYVQMYVICKKVYQHTFSRYMQKCNLLIYLRHFNYYVKVNRSSKAIFLKLSELSGRFR